MAAPPLPEAALESLVGEIADDFTRRHQRGEHPSLDEYAERYPELAGLLREILPAIVALSPSSEAQRSETPRASQTAGGGEHAPPPARIGDYEILAEIGRGGMGVVYKARHRALGRIVALKMLRSRDAADLERFRHEARAVALLQHPNVVQIFEVQEVDGQPFLALEHVPGGSLAERTKGEPQPPREAAALIETLAIAIAAAHDRGLVHRDLKPGNVLLQIAGWRSSNDSAVEPAIANWQSAVPKISDFGLAKRLDQDQGHTQTGAIVGTPSYMAPEQAVSGRAVGPAADIFALGAILYELIAGRPPFKGPSVLETLELVRHADPIPPSQLQPGCPRDLETICLKCLHKEPARRYTSGATLADDLRRFLNRQPIHARPVGNVERLGKWLRRRPAVAASLMLGTFVVLAVVAFTVRLVDSWELEDANQKLGEAVNAQNAALVEVRAARLKLDDALERERALHYAHSITLAHREWQENRIEQARRILDECPRDLRHWEWHFLYRQCHSEQMTIRGHVGGITALSVSPNGKLIAAASHRGPLEGPIASDLKVWDAATGELLHELVGQRNTRAIAFSPDSTQLASTGVGELMVRLWDLRNGRELRRIPTKTISSTIAFSPDGGRLAVGDHAEIRIFEVSSGAELFSLAGIAKSVSALSFSADGKHLASGGTDGVIKLWDLETRKEVASRRAHPLAVWSVKYSPKRDQFVSCAAGPAKGNVQGEVRLWNAEDAKPVPLTMDFPFWINAVAFSSDGEHLACAAGDGTVRFLDAKTGTTSFILRGHADAVRCLEFVPDGSRLVTGSADGTVRIWPARNPEVAELATLPTPPNGSVTALAWNANGDRLACSSYLASSAPQPGATSLRVLSVPPANDSPAFQAGKVVLALALAPDSRWLAAAELDAVRLWAVDNLHVRLTIPEPQVVGLAVSTDGQLLATASRNPAVDLRLDLQTDSSALVLPLKHPFSRRPGGALAAAPKIIPSIKVWRTTDGQLERVLDGQMTVAFSPDGSRLAGARDRSVKVWDVAAGNEVCTLGGLADPVLTVQFVDDGREIAAFTQRQATFWNVDTGQIVARVEGFNGPAFATPDGRRVVGMDRGFVRWWDVRLGRELLFLAAPDEARLGHIVLSADGHRLAAARRDRVLVWQAPPP